MQLVVPADCFLSEIRLISRGMTICQSTSSVRWLYRLSLPLVWWWMLTPPLSWSLKSSKSMRFSAIDCCSACSCHCSSKWKPLVCRHLLNQNHAMKKKRRSLELAVTQEAADKVQSSKTMRHAEADSQQWKENFGKDSEGKEKQMSLKAAVSLLKQHQVLQSHHIRDKRFRQVIESQVAQCCSHVSKINLFQVPQAVDHPCSAITPASHCRKSPVRSFLPILRQAQGALQHLLLLIFPRYKAHTDFKALLWHMVQSLSIVMLCFSSLRHTKSSMQSMPC